MPLAGASAGGTAGASAGGMDCSGGGGAEDEVVALASDRSTTTELLPVWKLFTWTGTASGKVAILRSGLSVTPLR